MDVFFLHYYLYSSKDSNLTRDTYYKLLKCGHGAIWRISAGMIKRRTIIKLIKTVLEFK